MPPRSPETPDVLVPHLQRVEDLLQKHLLSQDFQGLSRGLQHQLGSGGKRLRPAWTAWFGDLFDTNPDRVARAELERTRDAVEELETRLDLDERRLEVIDLGFDPVLVGDAATESRIISTVTRL